MKTFLIICFVFLGASIQADYQTLLFSFLQGADLIGLHVPDSCKASLSSLKDNLHFDNSWDSVISDSLLVSEICQFKNAIDVLAIFQESEELKFKAFSDLKQILLKEIVHLTSDYKALGYSVGEFLKPYLARVSPYVLKFESSQELADSVTPGPWPIAVFHGLGDCCYYPGMAQFTEYLRKSVGKYVRCVEIGDGSTTSWFKAFQSQSEEACAKVKADPEFANGLSVVGLSQGGLIARYIAEACGVNVHTAVTLGGPHMGVSKLPNCLSGFVCALVNDALDQGVYSPFSQDHVGPAGYFKDQFDFANYLKASNFLANLNNERSINPNYKQGIQSLDNLVLIKFTEDTVVDPPDSEWFGYFENNTWKLQYMNETSDYLNDLIGLQEIFNQGKIHFIPIVGNHLQFTEQEFTQQILPYLLN